MIVGNRQPSLEEMEEIVKAGAQCLECDATECHEFTPEGVDVCAGLPFWDGKPVTRSMLLEWKGRVAAQGRS